MLLHTVLSTHAGGDADSGTPKRAHDGQSERVRTRPEYGSFLDRASTLLFKADPIRINLWPHTDEYHREADDCRV